ncbi:OmpA family protein [Acinetobacter haemolyticus]|uniref:OmpA family protein n=1 Tax=Acinetobacter haemolyticus TaxID=29430 RepID=UPI0021CDE5D5|nr:OmpA family protein [Acinetobacter haemolyticus]MCU4377141.1 OmpA family protein [Acinetobacter haemolyticus]
MRNNRKVLLSMFIMACCGLVQSHTVLAAPIVVEGVVPNESSKQAILVKMQSVYGADQVVDKIQVRPVSAPNGWSDSVTRVITPDLKRVKQGQLRVRGTQIELTGKMSNPNEIQPTASNFQSLVQQPYRFNAQLSVNLAEQKVIDDALKDRIIEFESGSAILTETGKRILDEMAVALNKVGGKQVKIIGHTDSSGDASRNVILSKERAVAVQDYLVSKNIATDRLSTEGKGASEPIADNATADGRRKNRRIEFEVL